MNDRPELRVLSGVVRRLEALGLPYALGGSIASGVWGQPRYTNDIDVSVALQPEDIERFVAAFQDEFLVSVAEFTDALRSPEEYRSGQLLHMEEVFKVDVFVPLPSAFAQSCLARARPIEVVTGLCGRCLSAEDTIIHKLRWYELGNRVSDRQWNDIVQVIEVQAERLDREYILSWAREFGLEELAVEAFSEALPPEL
jgi:hypothetical protein